MIKGNEMQLVTKSLGIDSVALCNTIVLSAAGAMTVRRRKGDCRVKLPLEPESKSNRAIPVVNSWDWMKHH